MNSVIATTKSSVYLAIKHIFPDVPINAGTFAPLEIIEPKGTFLYAEYPRPVSGCAAEVSQRIAEAVFNALTPAIPDLQRRLALSRLILDAWRKRDEGALTPSRAARLADGLASLLDQVQTERLSFDGLAALAPEDYDDLDQMVRDVKKRIRDKIKKSDFNEALYLLVSRKLEKVAAYIKQFND